ncbi:MAG: hypothetical protein JO041_03935 [Acidobacteria bacterium]|nr:hypothetical protein [Acidobacteriota bacterium]
MKKTVLIGCSLFFLAAFGLAQEKIASQWKCGSSTEQHAMDVGDRQHHQYVVGKAACTAARSDANEKEGSGVQFDEISGNNSQWHGEFISTTDSGDKIYYSYRGKGTLKDNMVENGHHAWTIHGGTGKFKNARGSGTCDGKLGEGATVWDCNGTYTTARGASMARKPAMPPK